MVKIHCAGSLPLPRDHGDRLVVPATLAVAILAKLQRQAAEHRRITHHSSRVSLCQGRGTVWFVSPSLSFCNRNFFYKKITEIDSLFYKKL
jgi:hypothetical protein